MSDRPHTPTDHARPETYPAYQATQRVSAAEAGESVLVGIKRTGMDTYFADGEVLHHDLAGRLLRVARPIAQWRRGLSGRMIEWRRRARDLGGGLDRRALSESEVDLRVDEAAMRMRPVADALRGSDCAPAPVADTAPVSVAAMRELLAAAAHFDARAARGDVAQFRAIYHDVPILPPDQYSSLVLVASDGCRYNKCTFCGFYRDTDFHAKTLDEFQAHVRAVMIYQGRSLALRRGIFLGQANALLGPRPWREEILRIVHGACELPAADRTAIAPAWWQGSLSRFTGITSFLDAFVGARISPAEFAALRQLNLRQIFIGMESGADSLLQWLRKPATAAHMLETVRAAKAGGVRVGVMVLVGAGGERFFDEHVRDTVHVIRAMGLEPGDYVYLSPLVSVPGAEYDRWASAEPLVPLTPERLAAQEQLIRQGLRAVPGRRGPYVARYEVETFVY